MSRVRLAAAAFADFRFLAGMMALAITVTGTTCLSLWFDSGAGGEAAFWWSNAILLSALLLNGRHRWPAIFVVGYVTNVASHLVMHDSFFLSVGLSLCDMLEVAIAVYPFVHLTRDAVRFSRPRELTRLCLIGGLLAPAISSLCAAAICWIHGPIPTHFTMQWFCSNMLGTIIVTPVTLSLLDGEVAALFQPNRLPELVALLSLMILIPYGISHLAGLPMFFTVFPPLLLLTVRLGMGGGVLGICVIGFISIVVMLHQDGPIAQLHDITWQRRVFLIQILLASAVVCVALVAVVLNERRLLEQAARKSEQLYRLLAENSRDIIVLTDLQHNRKYVSPAVQWTMGWDPVELLGTSYADSIVHPDDIPAMTTTLDALKSGEPAKTLTYRCQKKDGSYLWMEANISLYCDRVTGEPIGFVNVVRNISERKASEEKLQDAYLALEALASVDALTGAANRRRFDECLAQEWRRAIRTGYPISLLLLDVDHFKLYNDFYGHLRGDSCLRQIAQIALKTIQRPGDTVARFGGEEFAAILPDTPREGAIELAERLRAAVEALGMEHAKSSHNAVTVSIGCATMIPEKHMNANLLIEAADQTLYEAKRGGRNKVVNAIEPSNTVMSGDS
ncbi:MAG TPA: diguanylate cyclase [Alloacidobacterium sp.]|nr:diguanylate cyclase [Alloacidobacterium sp.]